MKVIGSFTQEHDFLSNFYPSPVRYEGIVYPTVENAYQAAKTFDNVERLNFVRLYPGAAKRKGRKIEVRPDWEKVKFSIMMALVEQKFQIPELREKLIATRSYQLIEGNLWHDNIWGQCLCRLCEDRNIKGSNWLGKILMAVRMNILKENKDEKTGDVGYDVPTSMLRTVTSPALSKRGTGKSGKSVRPSNVSKPAVGRGRKTDKSKRGGSASKRRPNR